MLRRGPAAAAGLALLLGPVLAGCSGDAEPAAEGSDTPAAPTSSASSEAPSESASLPTPSSTQIDPNEAYGLNLPAGVKLTREGRHFTYGRTARVGFLVDKKVGLATLNVTGVRKGSMKDFEDFVIDEKTAKATPYYVDVDLENVGKSDLGDLVIPLMLTDGNGTLVEQSTFAATFEPCAASPLPAEFPPGEKISTCLVFVVAPPGKLQAVTFRPSPTFAPIDWKPKPAKPKKSGGASGSPSETAPTSPTRPASPSESAS